MEAMEKLRVKTDLIELGRSYFRGMCDKICSLWQEISRSPEQVNEDAVDHERTSSNFMASFPFLSSLTKAGSTMTNALTRMTRAALDDVTKMTELVTGTLPSGLTKKGQESQAGEIPSDANKKD
jgi:hypothetical protein